MRPRLFLPLAAVIFLQAISLFASEKIASWDGTVFRIDDAKTRVSIASVKLSVSDLKPEDGNLVGEYTIEVPLMSSKNDKGRIVLPLSENMDHLGANGGVLTGQAISYQEGKKPNEIVCEIRPHEDQKILLDITTPERVLKFTSRYLILDESKDS